MATAPAALALVLLAGCAPVTHPSRWTGGPVPMETPQRVSGFENVNARECEWEAASSTRSVWTRIDDRYVDRDLFEACMGKRGFMRR